MKYKILMFLSLFLLAGNLMAQENEKVKKIEVVGRAEKEVVPDEIYLSIALKEYKSDKNTVVSIEKLEKELAKAVKNAGIADQDFQIENIYGNNFWYWKKKKDDQEFLATKRYRLKLNDLSKVNDILDPLDPKGIEYMNINEYSHSSIEQYRKELKVEALKAAKNKAQYLLESIGQDLGPAIEIQEVAIGRPNYGPMAANMRMAAESMDQGNSDIGFKTIKLQAEIRAVFEIRE